MCIYIYIFIFLSIHVSACVCVCVCVYIPPILPVKEIILYPEIQATMDFLPAPHDRRSLPSPVPSQAAVARFVDGAEDLFQFFDLRS